MLTIWFESYSARFNVRQTAVPPDLDVFFGRGPWMCWARLDGWFGWEVA